MSDLEMRELQFNAVQDKGESLVMERHPASKLIEVLYVYVCLWITLEQLTVLVQDFVKKKNISHKFYSI